MMGMQYPQQTYGFAAMPAPPMQQWNMHPQAFVQPNQQSRPYTHASRASFAQRGHGKSPSFQYSGGFALRPTSGSISRPAPVSMPKAPDVLPAPFIPQYQHQQPMRPYQQQRFNPPQIPRFEPTSQRPVVQPQQFLSPNSPALSSGSRSPISPSIARSSAVSPANANFTPLGLPVKQHATVKLCKEDNTDHRRIALDQEDWPEWIAVAGLEIVSREVHVDEVPRDELPSTIEIYLPGNQGWVDLLEELWRSRPAISDEQYRNLPPDLLRLKLDDLVNDSAASSPEQDFRHISQPKSPALPRSIANQPTLNPSAPVFLNPAAPTFKLKPSFNPDAPVFNPAGYSQQIPTTQAQRSAELPRKASDLSREELEFGLGIQVSSTEQLSQELPKQPTDDSEDFVSNPSDVSDSGSDVSHQSSRNHAPRLSIQSDSRTSRSVKNSAGSQRPPLDNVRHFKFPTPERAIPAPVVANHERSRSFDSNDDSLWGGSHHPKAPRSQALSLDDIALPSIPRRGSRAILAGSRTRRKITPNGRLLGRTTSATSLELSESEDDKDQYMTDIDDEMQSQAEIETWQLLSDMLDTKLKRLQDDLTGCFNITADMDTLKRDALLDGLLGRLESQIQVWSDKQESDWSQRVSSQVSPTALAEAVFHSIQGLLQPVILSLEGTNREITGQPPEQSFFAPDEVTSGLPHQDLAKSIVDQLIANADWKEQVQQVRSAHSSNVSHSVLKEELNALSVSLVASIGESFANASGLQSSTVNTLREVATVGKKEFVTSATELQEKLGQQIEAALQSQLQDQMSQQSTGIQHLLAKQTDAQAAIRAEEISAARQEKSDLIAKVQSLQELLSETHVKTAEQLSEMVSTLKANNDRWSEQNQTLEKYLEAERESSCQAKTTHSDLQKEMQELIRRSASNERLAQAAIHNQEMKLAEIKADHQAEVSKLMQDCASAKARAIKQEAEHATELQTCKEKAEASEADKNKAKATLEEQLAKLQSENEQLRADLEQANAANIPLSPRIHTLTQDLYSTPTSMRRSHSSASSRPSLSRTPSRVVSVDKEGWWS